MLLDQPDQLLHCGGSLPHTFLLLLREFRLKDALDAARQDVSASGRISNRGARVEIQAQEGNRSGLERVDQRVQVLEGSRAFIYTGQSTPIFDGSVTRETASGFEAIPRLAGGGVVVEIAQRRDSPVQQQALSTTVSGRLGEWLEPLGRPPVRLAVFSSAPPEAYGLSYQALPAAGPVLHPPADLLTAGVPDLLCISANNLLGLFFFERNRAAYDWLRSREPLAVLGSIWVYDLGARPEDHLALAGVYERFDWPLWAEHETALARELGRGEKGRPLEPRAR